MELVVVTGIIVLLSGLLLFNFRATSTTPSALYQVVSVIDSDIRRVQYMAIAGTMYRGAFVCGYGLHYVDSKTYQLFVRPLGAGPCKTDPRPRLFMTGDLVMETHTLINNAMVFESSFPDIFFELPDPTIYINNDPTPGVNKYILIKVVVSGKPVPPLFLRIYTSGRIDVTN